MPTLRAALKFFLFGLLIVVIVPLQSIVLMVHKGRGAYIFPRLFHKLGCRIFGVRFTIKGAPDTAHQTVFMSNHVSYLDIPLLGSILPYTFLAKQEVEGWALFGFLSKLQQTVYIIRRKTALLQAKGNLKNFLESGRSMIVFPEGTSTSGMNVKPFKSSIFSIADTRPSLWFQPVTIVLTHVDGRRPRTKEEFDIYAWPLEMEDSIGQHLWKFARTSGAHLDVVFHPAIPAAGHDRKSLAKTCHDIVSMGLQRALNPEQAAA